MNRYRVIPFLVATAVAAGCVGAKEVARIPVKGRITLDGKLLPGSTVVFESKAAGVAQTATTNEDGQYEFVAYNAAGLPAGSYKVMVTAGRFMQPGEEIPRVDPKQKAAAVPARAVVRIPDKYGKAESSTLTAEVKDGEPQAFDFELKSQP